MLCNEYVLMAKSIFFFAINKVDVLLQKIKSKQYLSESCPEAQTMQFLDQPNKSAIWK